MWESNWFLVGILFSLCLLLPHIHDVLQETECHEGGKGFNLTFLENDRILTVGFSKTSQRQVSLWDLESGNLSEPISTTQIDVNPGILFPYYDAGTGIAALAGRVRLVFFAFLVHACARSLVHSSI